MSQSLIEKAIAQIWCTPGQDAQAHFKLAKATYAVPGPNALAQAAQPVYNNFNLNNRNLFLPDTTSAWFIYTLGSLFQTGQPLPFVNYTWEKEVWIPLTTPLTANNLLTWIYTDTGICFPLFRCFYMYTIEGILLLAVPSNINFPDLTTEDLYLRFYQNAFYSSTRSSSGSYALQTGNAILTAPSDITAINTTIAGLTATSGYCFLSINGRQYRNPDPSFVAAGDFVEWIYDPTIDHVETYSLESSLNYQSTLDDANKTVFHGSLDSYFTSIAFQDDLDIDLLTSIGTNQFFGLRYPVQDDSSVRMLTHRDYGLNTPLIDAAVTEITNENPSGMLTAVSIEVKFRKSGYQRLLVNTTGLVADLYTLPSTAISETLTQTPATFSTFSAPTIENSAYPQVMGASDISVITETLAENAYGYNGATQVCGAAPVQVTITSGAKSVPIPDNYAGGYVAYEYNINGQFLQYVSGSGGTSYTPSSSNCYIVELIKGVSAEGPVVNYGNNNVSYNPNAGFRVYACPQTDGVPTRVWTDITATTEYTLDTTHFIVTWANPSDTRYMMVRDDTKVVISNSYTQFSNNFMSFGLTEFVDRGSGAAFYPSEIAAADMFVMMNGRSLAMGIDYFVEFPNIYITNFNYLVQPVVSSNQIFHVRLAGLPSQPTTMNRPLDVGRVVHGFLGTNGTYVPKNDKLLRVTVNGYLKSTGLSPAAFKFAQDDQTTQDPANPNNGLVYQVQTYNVPLSDVLGHNQETYKDASRTLDSQLVSYMDTNLTFFNRGLETFSASPTAMVCPFHAKVIDDVISGVITSAQTASSQTDTQVETTLASYVHLITNGPCNPANGFVGNTNYLIRPHPALSPLTTLSANQVSFIVRASTLMTPGAIINVTSYFAA